MKNKLKAGYEVITVVLAFFAVAFAVLDLAHGLNQWQWIADKMILAIFIIDYIVRLRAADNKRDFVKNNILDLIAIIPFSSFFRAFRIAHFVRLARLVKVSRLAAYVLRLANRTKTFFNTNGFKYVLALNCVIIVVAAVLIHFAEGMRLSEGFWWVFVTITTVGYGDVVPHTKIGHVIAVALMVTGIGLIGTLTSAITSFFLNLKEEKMTHREEILNLVIRQLENPESLSNEDIDRICDILQTFKRE